MKNYRTPTSDRAPHKFELSDSSGSIQIAVWNDVWNLIPFRTKVQSQDGLPVTVRVTLKLFRNEVEGHIGSAYDILEGEAIPQAVGPIQWLTSISEAVGQARSTQKPILVF